MLYKLLYGTEKAGQPEAKSIMSQLPPALPALMKAEKVQQKAHRVGFEWENLTGSKEKIAESLAQQHIAQFFLQMHHIITVNGLYHFIGFFQQILAQGLMSLISRDIGWNWLSLKYHIIKPVVSVVVMAVLVLGSYYGIFACDESAPYPRGNHFHPTTSPSHLSAVLLYHT